ncbi:hypothetical protein K503DRAFT_787164 [Rhizopogon vinicolor AM-OR11-026]|uniref:Uncharacterized protein n=1 Tax=Rhizopogon vinicolor AM-OR11-026 TaxID=1314800 RepID=A0A1B7MIT6_9AGAM|nr:hypothetical protein K503DRAFT_787164 [Rhizopogon vinicolor AM-OR11-026]
MSLLLLWQHLCLLVHMWSIRLAGRTAEFLHYLVLYNLTRTMRLSFLVAIAALAASMSILVFFLSAYLVTSCRSSWQHDSHVTTEKLRNHLYVTVGSSLPSCRSWLHDTIIITSPPKRAHGYSMVCETSPSHNQ